MTTNPEDDEMGEECSKHGKDENLSQITCRKETKM